MAYDATWANEWSFRSTAVIIREGPSAELPQKPINFCHFGVTSTFLELHAKGETEMYLEQSPQVVNFVFTKFSRLWS